MLENFRKRLEWKFKSSFVYPRQVKGRQKFFCIGRNKTGTTSIKRAFEQLGFIVGMQGKAEKLLPAYAAGNFDPIIRYCKSAQVFQDFPFSYPETFSHLDKAYPGSKFILTVRDSPDQWYNSVVKFHSRLVGNGEVPTATHLKEAEYVWKGWMWECNRLLYNTPEDEIYNADIFKQSYIDYNDSVLSYFKDRPEDLLVLNLAEENSYQRFTDFIGVDSPFDDFPWENKTSQVKALAK